MIPNLMFFVSPLCLVACSASTSIVPVLQATNANNTMALALPLLFDELRSSNGFLSQGVPGPKGLYLQL